MVATEWAYLLVGEAFLCVESERPVWPSGYLSPCLVYVLAGKIRVQRIVCSGIGKEARSQQINWHVKVQRLSSKPYAYCKFKPGICSSISRSTWHKLHLFLSSLFLTTPYLDISDYNDAPPPPPPSLLDPLHPCQRPPKHPRLPPSRPQSLTSNRPDDPAHNHHRAIPPSLHLWPSRSRCRNARAKRTPHSHWRRVPRSPARRPDDLPRPRTTSRIPHHRPQAPWPQRKVLREPARKCSDADLRALRRRDPPDGASGRVG